MKRSSLRSRPSTHPVPLSRGLREPGLASAALLALAFAACKPSPVLVAERSAPIGQEFIRLYPDGKAEYGFAVVKENFKARGGYRYAHDTVFFLDGSFRPHFPAGYLPIKDDVLFMDNGLHFKIKTDKLTAK